MRGVTKNSALPAVLLLLICIPGCSPVYNVSYDYDEALELHRLSTYDWMPVPEEAGVNSLDRKRIREAVDAELALKGMVLDRDSPDFLIAADIVTKEKLGVRHTGYYPPYYPFYYPYRVYRGFPVLDYYQYREGTFMLDFVEPSTGRLIWHGAARAVMDHADTPAARDRLVREAVHEILQNFPPL